MCSPFFILCLLHVEPPHVTHAMYCTHTRRSLGYRAEFSLVDLDSINMSETRFTYLVVTIHLIPPTNRSRRGVRCSVFNGDRKKLIGYGNPLALKIVLLSD